MSKNKNKIKSRTSIVLGGLCYCVRWDCGYSRQLEGGITILLGGEGRVILCCK